MINDSSQGINNIKEYTFQILRNRIQQLAQEGGSIISATAKGGIKVSVGDTITYKVYYKGEWEERTSVILHIEEGALIVFLPNRITPFVVHLSLQNTTIIEVHTL